MPAASGLPRGDGRGKNSDISSTGTGCFAVQNISSLGCALGCRDISSTGVAASLQPALPALLLTVILLHCCSKIKTALKTPALALKTVPLDLKTQNFLGLHCTAGFTGIFNHQLHFFSFIRPALFLRVRKLSSRQNCVFQLECNVFTSAPSRNP